MIKLRKSIKVDSIDAILCEELSKQRIAGCEPPVL